MVRRYGKPARKTRGEGEILFAELLKSPLKPQAKVQPVSIQQIGKGLKEIAIADSEAEATSEGDKENIGLLPASSSSEQKGVVDSRPNQARPDEPPVQPSSLTPPPPPPTPSQANPSDEPEEQDQTAEYTETDESLRILTWDDVCPPGDTIQKIAEASYAEVYRITNERGTSIIKVIRLPSPIKPQTKAQQKSGLVDEEPHSEESMAGELQISEWLADVPGFVIYKERYVVQGKAPKALLETHQLFHRRMKRQDPDRLQFYPSPSRYLDETKFLVVELGDAGTALEDFVLDDVDQVWDIFLHTAIALARAEELVQFEHRDLHEGNLCIRIARSPKPHPTGPNNDPDDSHCRFGYSGLEITILDYGLSRASDPDFDDDDSHSSCSSSSSPEEPKAVIFSDLESDLLLFTSTHAAQCTTYRQMRSYLLSGCSRGGRRDPFLEPSAHSTPYDLDITTLKPISWRDYHPYTNVLWLSYIYRYLTDHFLDYRPYSSPGSGSSGGRSKTATAAAGKKARQDAIASFKTETRELWTHLDPMASRKILSFSCAVDVVRFAVEAGWVRQEQLLEEGGDGGEGRSMLNFLDDSFAAASEEQGDEHGDENREGCGDEVEEEQKDDSRLRQSLPYRPRTDYSRES